MTEEFLSPNDPRADMSAAERRSREDNLQAVGQSLPGVLAEIHSRSQASDLIKARREYRDLQHRAQSDASVSQEDVSAAYSRLVTLQVEAQQTDPSEQPPEQ